MHGLVARGPLGRKGPPLRDPGTPGHRDDAVGPTGHPAAQVLPVAVVEAYTEVARRVLAGPARLGRTRLVAVDGPSGAGKSRFAAHLADALAALPGGRPPVVHTDDLLDGWDDQLTFWPRLDGEVLARLRRGEPGAYRRYSWVRRCFLPRPVPVPVTPVLIVEGVSAARAVVRPELTLAVFVTAPAPLRLARAVERDGPEILPELRRWHAGERAHFAADDTVAHADLVVDGAPALPLDTSRYFVRVHTAGTGSAGSPG